MRIRWTRQALSNLDAAIHLAADNPGNAQQVARKVWDSIQLLRQQPGMGRPGRVPETRELIIADLPFIVPYAEHNGEIVILRIMHTSMKWPELF
jgi:toxin ParE1/3/4